MPVLLSSDLSGREPVHRSSTTTRAAGLRPRDARNVWTSTTFVNSRRLKPAARRVFMVVVFVKHGAGVASILSSRRLPQSSSDEPAWSTLRRVLRAVVKRSFL